jgi:uncharacterized membrane protein
MWILIAAGLGFAIGALTDGLDGGALGAIAGGLVGAVVLAVTRPRREAAGTERLAEAERRIEHIYKSLEHIHYRLEEIERRVGSMPKAMQEAAAAAPRATEDGAASIAAAALPPIELATAAPRAAAPAALAEVAPLADARRADVTAGQTPRERPAQSGVWVDPARAPREPAAWQRWLFGGNTMVRVGIVILFFGVAFLLKYAAEAFTVPIELRLAGIAAGGIALFVLGWRLRTARPGYALTLQGGGIGVLYLTVFAAFRLYDVLPVPIAFALLLGLVAASGVLAVRQESQALAMLGAAGGFLAPILASTGQGSHVMLFSYYVVLNLGILGIAWARAWRPLNLLGFVFTFVIAAVWGAGYYRPDHYATTQPFLAIFFLMYVGIAVLYATRRSIALAHYVDGTLVFGTPLVAFALQSRLVRDIEYGLAFSALAVAAVYLGLAAVLWARRAQGLRLLVESFLGLGVVFVTLAIPLALDGRWTSAAWALEGAAIVWASSRQRQRIGQWFGVLLQPAAAVAFIDGAWRHQDAYPLLNAVFLGGMFLALAALFAGRVIVRRPEAFGPGAARVATLLLLWSAGWALVAGVREAHALVPWRYLVAALLGVVAVWAAAYVAVRRRLDWRAALTAPALLLPLMLALTVLAVLYLPHPFARYAWAGWLATFAVLYGFLRLHESELPGWTMRATHIGGAWLVVALLCWEAGWRIDRVVAGDGTWPFVAWAVVPCAALFALPVALARQRWPFGAHRRSYAVGAAAPIALYLYLWLFVANAASDGRAAPLPYVPLLNPLDLACLAVIVAIAWWYVALRRHELASRLAPGEVAVALGVAAFAWANGALLRTLHHWAAIPYALHDMLRSTLAQTAISVFWTVLAVGAMLYATRSARRPVWIAGAFLLAVVVLKLFMFDLSRLAGIERIVSFLAVGALLLAIGWFSPVPPRASGVASDRSGPSASGSNTTSPS